MSVISFVNIFSHWAVDCFCFIFNKHEKLLPSKIILIHPEVREREITYDIPYMWNIKRNDTNELTKQKETPRLRKWTHGWRWEGRVKDFGKVIHTLLYFKWITNKSLLYSKWNSAQCYEWAWMGGEFGGEWIHVYVWLSPFTVHLTLSPHC